MKQLALQFDARQSVSQPIQQPTQQPIAAGEKAKAHDIIAAIRTLKAVEQEQAPPRHRRRAAAASHVSAASALLPCGYSPTR